MDNDIKLQRDMFRVMLLSRRLDERAWLLHRQSKISFHLSAIGHEAVQVGAGFALQRGKDWVAPYARDLTLLLALGLKPQDFMLSLFGKHTDQGSGGRQMSDSWSFPAAKVISISGIAASHMLHAVGIAHGMRIRRENSAVLVSCGEGATSMGEWFEAVNWAAVHHLPLVFLVQNNGLALSTRQQRQMLRSPISKASGLGLPCRKVDGTNPLLVYQTVSQALQNARAGKGPCLIEAQVLRIPPHSSDDDDRSYRTRDEVQEARRQDPLLTTQSSLLKEGVFTQDQLEQLEVEVDAQVEDAVRMAELAHYPVPEEAAGPLFACLDENPIPEGVDLPSTDGIEFTLLKAIHKAMDLEMERDEDIVLLGNDIGIKGGVFRATEGFLEKFGPERVIDAPLSGAALVGVGVGLALYGLKPLCEVQFADFIFPAFNQIVSEAARIHYRSGGHWRVPLVIRAPYGGGVGGGLYHSQSVEAFFTHVPGLKVVIPSSPEEAWGLIKSALQEPNPVLFFEPKRGYR